jgi:hypothetical protein
MSFSKLGLARPFAYAHQGSRHLRQQEPGNMQDAHLRKIVHVRRISGRQPILDS